MKTETELRDGSRLDRRTVGTSDRRSTSVFSLVGAGIVDELRKTTVVLS